MQAVCACIWLCVCVCGGGAQSAGVLGGAAWFQSGACVGQARGKVRMVQGLGARSTVLTTLATAIRLERGCLQLACKVCTHAWSCLACASTHMLLSSCLVTAASPEQSALPGGGSGTMQVTEVAHEQCDMPGRKQGPSPWRRWALSMRYPNSFLGHCAKAQHDGSKLYSLNPPT